MEEQGFRQSLITSNIWKNERQSSKIAGFLIFVKYGLKFVMWVIFIAWLVLIFLFPSNFAYDFFVLWIEMSQPTCFGVAGSVFMLFMAPLLVVTLIGAIYIKLFPASHMRRKKRRLFLWDLSTFPVLVDGPLRVVSAAEFLWIALFTSYIVWATSSFVLQELTTVSEVVAPFKEKCYLFFQMIGFDLALVGIFLIGFLFLPISRGSILLRLIEVPIEHAVKYHVWLGHITMACFTLHGLCFLASWTLDGTLLYQITQWQSSGVAYLPGIIALLAGLLMWVTSLYPVRRSYFEIFFYTHQLYIVFLVFLAMHVSDFTLYIAGGGIFLFLIDRFLRFCQSRPTVDVVSAKCLPCGVVELTLAIPQNIRYNALSFVFVQVQGLSWLQWHPFSVSSSPLDGKRHVSVLIKALGQWTKKLRESLMDVQDCNDTYFSQGYPAMVSASVEGPYGHETPYFLQY